MFKDHSGGETHGTTVSDLDQMANETQRTNVSDLDQEPCETHKAVVSDLDQLSLETQTISVSDLDQNTGETQRAAVSDLDHVRLETHQLSVSDLDQSDCETQNQAVSDLDQKRNETQLIVVEITSYYRMFKDMQNAALRINNQCMAICRRLCDGDKVEGARLYRAVKTGGEHPLATDAIGALVDLLPHIDAIKKGSKKYEKHMAKLAKTLPVWPWVEEVRGIGAPLFAQIVGEAGDLSKYDNPAKLWKRMGMAVINGKSQRKVAGSDAVEQGYCPRRRALMYNVGACFLRSSNEKYRAMYDERREMELEKIPESSDMHRHRRAQRYIEKRFLKELWEQWNPEKVKFITLVPKEV